MPMRFAVALTILSLTTMLACSDDAAVGNADDTSVDGDGGDINTDLFTPGDGGDTEDDGAADVSADTGTDTPVEDNGGGTLDRYDSCGFGGPQCEPPLTCVGNCQLPCSAGCPEGEECIDLSGFGAAGVCGVRGGQGDACDVTMGQFCDEDLSCTDGECVAPTISGEGDACGGLDQQCDEGLTCVFTGFGEGLCQVACENGDACDEDEVCVTSFEVGGGACLEDCDLTSDPECSDNVAYQCREPIGGGDAACFPRVGNPPGDQGFGDVCGGAQQCADGLFCPGLQGSYCTATCASPTDCPTEPAGAECVSLALQGVCTFTCPSGDAADCPEGMACNNVFGQMLCAWP